MRKTTTYKPTGPFKICLVTSLDRYRTLDSSKSLRKAKTMAEDEAKRRGAQCFVADSLSMIVYFAPAR